MDEINDNLIDITDEDFSEVNLPADPAEGESIDWEAEAKKFQGIATRRGTKLAKLKTVAPVKKPEEQKPAESKKGELDYGQKAFLIANGFKDAEDHALVEGIMKQTGSNLESVLGSAFVQSELKRLGEERVTKAAAPSAKDGRQGSPARDTVDYWLAKGELPPADQRELRQQVVNAKIAKAKGGNVFSATPVVGR